MASGPQGPYPVPRSTPDCRWLSSLPPLSSCSPPFSPRAVAGARACSTTPSRARPTCRGPSETRTAGRTPACAFGWTTGRWRAVTDPNGIFRFDTVPSGVHTVDLDPPRATVAVTSLPASVRTAFGQPSQVSLVIAPRPVAAVLNLGTVDTRGEVRDASGQPPGSPSTPLFARNVVDPPLGQLTPIETPLGLPVTREEWDDASGEASSTATAATSTVTLEAGGLIPNGTYSVWLSFLNADRAPGELIAATDVVRTEPLGAVVGVAKRPAGDP